MEDPKSGNPVSANLEKEGESSDQATVDVGANEGHTVDEGGVVVEASPLRSDARRLSTILILLGNVISFLTVGDIHTHIYTKIL